MSQESSHDAMRRAVDAFDRGIAYKEQVEEVPVVKDYIPEEDTIDYRVSLLGVSK